MIRHRAKSTTVMVYIEPNQQQCWFTSCQINNRAGLHRAKSTTVLVYIVPNQQQCCSSHRAKSTTVLVHIVPNQQKYVFTQCLINESSKCLGTAWFSFSLELDELELIIMFNNSRIYRQSLD